VFKACGKVGGSDLVDDCRLLQTCGSRGSLNPSRPHLVNAEGAAVGHECIHADVELEGVQEEGPADVHLRHLRFRQRDLVQAFGQEDPAALCILTCIQREKLSFSSVQPSLVQLFSHVTKKGEPGKYVVTITRTRLGAIVGLHDVGDALGQSPPLCVELRAEVLGVVGEDPGLGVEAVLPLRTRV
jgi:hypothetical protein